MFQSIKMAHFNGNGKQIHEPKGQIKMNIVRRFGGWVAKIYPILKLKYFEDSNTWKKVEPIGGGQRREAAQQKDDINDGLVISNNTATSSKECSEGGADQSISLHTYSHDCFGNQSFPAVKEELDCKSNVMKNETVPENEMVMMNSLVKKEPENKSSQFLDSAEKSSNGISFEKTIVISSLDTDDSKAFMKCHVQLPRLSEKQVQKYLSLDEKCSPSNEKSGPPEKPSRSSQPRMRHKRWKAWRQCTAKPTICGAHISSEATSGPHDRHSKKKILLKAVKLDKTFLLGNGKSYNKNNIQLDHVKFKMMKNILFREKWLKNHSISNGKENSPACKPKIRKSRRITAKRIKYEKLMQVKSKILSKCEDGIKMAEFEGKGRGVVTTRAFSKGDFVVEYSGELTTIHDALKRERQYEDDETIGCYMYFFLYNSTRYCVDATDETAHLGRLINHSRLRSNLVTRIVPILGKPHLALEARADLAPGTELLLDYGDRSRQALENHPWLRL